MEKAREYNLNYKKKNKEKLKKQRRKYIAKNKEKTVKANRKLKLKQRYGMTHEEYEVQYKIQSGQCAICGDYRERLDIDHCHITGTVRGLLCGNCNRGLGLFRDSPGVLNRAIIYLAD